MGKSAVAGARRSAPGEVSVGSVSFFVPGVPATQGSGFALLSKTTKRPVYVPDNKKALRDWRRAVRLAASRAFENPFPGAVALTLRFYLPPPKRAIRVSPTTRPDLDKLVRAALDALSGVAYTDDGQVVEVHASKAYAMSAGLEVLVREVGR